MKHLLLSMLLIAACTKQKEPTIIGKWITTHETINGFIYDNPAPLTLNSDGSGTYYDVQLTYIVAGDSLLINFSSGKAETWHIVELAPDNMVLRHLMTYKYFARIAETGE